MSENNRNLEPMPEEAVYESPQVRLARMDDSFHRHGWKIDDTVACPQNTIILGQRQQLDRMTDLLRETQHFAKAILNTANELASKVNYYESVVPRKDQRIAELEAESHDLKLALNYEQDKVAVLTREIAKLKAAAKKK